MILLFITTLTTKKRLTNVCKKNLDIISEDESITFFNNPNVIDIYRIVQKYTDWPVGSCSLKTLNMYLGFKWRDEAHLGALSIQWFNEYLDKKDPLMLGRVLLYNENDCKTTMVRKDGIEKIQRK